MEKYNVLTLNPSGVVKKFNRLFAVGYDVTIICSHIDNEGLLTVIYELSYSSKK